MNALSKPAAPAPGHGLPRLPVVTLGLASALSALAGGLALALSRPGSAHLPALEVLEHTPFDSFLVPGLLLATVVGGTSLAGVILAWRRATLAVDATVLAGGALTVWIVAEMAIVREPRLWHVLYGGLGTALLGIGIWTGWGSGVSRQRWVVAVTVAEAAGFLLPATAGVLSGRLGLGDLPQAALVVCAGFLEGLLLGAGQAFAFPRALRRTRYALLTATGAGAVWGGAMSLSE